VTRGHDLIEKIAKEKKSLDKIESTDCDKSWAMSAYYYIKSAIEGCSQCRIGITNGSNLYTSRNSNGFTIIDGVNYSMESVDIGLDRKHTIAALKSQIEDDMKELNILGITP
jgi:hypothetical protein